MCDIKKYSFWSKLALKSVMKLLHPYRAHQTHWAFSTVFVAVIIFSSSSVVPFILTIAEFFVTSYAIVSVTNWGVIPLV